MVSWPREAADGFAGSCAGGLPSWSSKLIRLSSCVHAFVRSMSKEEARQTKQTHEKKRPYKRTELDRLLAAALWGHPGLQELGEQRMALAQLPCPRQLLRGRKPILKTARASLSRCIFRLQVVLFSS